jgi:hypothetical protein
MSDVEIDDRAVLIACGACGDVQPAATWCRACGKPLASAATDAAGGAPHLGAWLAGIPLAAALFWLPGVKLAGTFVATCVHETGHLLAGWGLGLPCHPVAHLDSHYAMLHGRPIAAVAIAAWVLLVAAGWWLRRRFAGRLLLAGAVVHPLLYLSAGKEIVHLAGGLLLETAVASFCLWRALRPWESEGMLVRVLHAGVGWFLVARNVLVACLLFDAIGTMRVFGMRNLLPAYTDVTVALTQLGLHGSSVVAAGVLAVALLPLLLSLGAVLGQRACQAARTACSRSAGSPARGL